MAGAAVIGRRWSERFEGDDRPRVDDAGDDLHPMADEMADVDVLLDVELGEDVEVAGGRVDLRGDLGLGEGARRLRRSVPARI